MARCTHPSVADNRVCTVRQQQRQGQTDRSRETSEVQPALTRVTTEEEHHTEALRAGADDGGEGAAGQEALPRNDGAEGDLVTLDLA